MSLKSRQFGSIFYNPNCKHPVTQYVTNVSYRYILMAKKMPSKTFIVAVCNRKTSKKNYNNQ